MNKDSLGIIVLLFIIGGILFYTHQRDKDFIENLSYTKGKITDYYNVGGKKYIQYTFYVKGKKYIGRSRVSVFKCSDGTEGCVGKVFKILYSSKNPDNNDIFLNQYQKYKFIRTRLY
ncbi:hypothetical protein [Tenacibaculum sp. 190524A05c]|uniref:DUF3592 domain-containing protein n=1 Tax=Tenacibaculum platacis TaxID=3137852 RepID=A0ABM9P663_9FLAO